MIQKEACSFIKNEILAQVFSYEFCEIFKNTFLTELARTTASGGLHLNECIWHSYVLTVQFQ